VSKGNYPVALVVMAPAPEEALAAHGRPPVSGVPDGVEGKDCWEGGGFHRDDHAAEVFLAPQKMRVDVGQLHPLTIPAKFACIGDRQLELSVPPACAATLQRLPPGHAGGGGTALPCVFHHVFPFKFSK
jgi:hypothetical protein